MSIKPFVITIILTMLASCSGTSDSSLTSSPEELELAPTSLRNSLLKEPYNLNKDDVTFSWVMNDRDSDEYQIQYRIKIAEGVENYNNSKWLYDTKWVSSNNNTCVRINELGSLLSDNSLYYWIVATKDKDGQESEFSEPKLFRTSLGSWQLYDGIWASNSSNQKSDNDFCFIRSNFEIENYDLLEGVFIDITATSPERIRQHVYNLYVNGVFVGIGPSRIGGNPEENQILYYNSFDITNIVKQNNSLGLVAYTTEEKEILLEITAYYKDGSKKTVINSGRDYQRFYSLEGDSVFRKSNSIGTGYYLCHANNIDTNKYPSNFSLTAFDDSYWNQCFKCNKLNDKYSLEPFQGVNTCKYLSDNLQVNKRQDSIFIDIGKEVVGGIHLEFESLNQGEIELHFSEQLDAEGNPKYRMITSNCYLEKYLLKSGHLTIENFSMMTYRYLEIVGDIDLLNNLTVKAVSYHIPYNSSESSFYCNNKLINDMFAIMKHTAEVTTQDLFVDSYSRERRAYEGDAFINQLLSYNLQCNYYPSRFTFEYLLNNPTWPAEYQLIMGRMAIEDYLYTGDISFLRKNYQFLKALLFDYSYDESLSLVTSQIENGDFYSYLIDWPENERDDYDTDVFYFTVFNCLHKNAYEDIAYIADELGFVDESEFYYGRASLIKQSLIKKFYNPDLGAFSDGMYSNGGTSSHYSQHATAYAMYCGIFDSYEMRDKMASFLDADIKMSVYGTYFLIMGLYNNGYGDIAYKMLASPSTTDNSRTWSYIMYTLKATISPEAWSENNKDNMTLSHPWSSYPSMAISNGIFGIAPTTPGFDTFTIKIQPGGLTNGSLTTTTLKGTISVSFDLTKKSFVMKIPANTEAKVLLPTSVSTKYLFDNGEQCVGSIENDYVRIILGSGEHVLTY